MKTKGIVNTLSFINKIKNFGNIYKMTPSEGSSEKKNSLCKTYSPVGFRL